MDSDPDALYACLKADLTEAVGSDVVALICSGVTSWPGMTTDEMAASSALVALLKKLEVRKTKACDDAAISLFHSLNARCDQWSLRLNTALDEELVGSFKSEIESFWYEGGVALFDHPYDALSQGRCGPGRTVGSEGNSFYAKLFSSRLSTTDLSLYRWYDRYIRNFPEWGNAEIIRRLNYGEAHVVDGSRISLVPKNDKISRLICTEPTLNSFFQIGFSAHIERRLKTGFGINLEQQPFRNQRLAKRGSEDGSVATIDLSSASDTISLRMVRQLLPRDFVTWLEKFRCTHTIIAGERHELSMLSTMGNGYTFSFQTALFMCVVRAAAASVNYRLARADSQYADWGVFGDDIVCPTFMYGRVIRLLELLGFIPNLDKSFAEGPFRESCGHDYYLGVNLRGVYVKTLRTAQDRYAVINQLNLFSARTGISLCATVQYLLERVKWQPVPCIENDDAGIRVPYFCLLPTDRWKCEDTQSNLYFCSRPRPSVVRIKGLRIVVPRHCKPLIYNPSGLLIAFLQRSINGGKMGVRKDTQHYHRGVGTVPNWDMVPATGFFSERPEAWRHWESAVFRNLKTFG